MATSFIEPLDGLETTEEGTPPNGYSFIDEADFKDLETGARDAIQAAINRWRDEGRTWCRVTLWTGEYCPPGASPGVWVEVWTEQPKVAAPFHPPLVTS